MEMEAIYSIIFESHFVVYSICNERVFSKQVMHYIIKLYIELHLLMFEMKVYSISFLVYCCNVR